jgi:hypothetical protein
MKSAMAVMEARVAKLDSWTRRDDSGDNLLSIVAESVAELPGQPVVGAPKHRRAPGHE